MSAKKTAPKITINLDTLQSRLNPIPQNWEVKEVKITEHIYDQASKQSRKVSDKVPATAIAAAQGEKGAHEHSHATQHRVGAFPAVPVMNKKKRKYTSSEEKTTFPASYEHNSMRTATVEHQITQKYIKSGVDFNYSNMIELYGRVIDKEYPQWRMDAKKIRFSLFARDKHGKVAPAKQLLAVTEMLFKAAFGSPSAKKGKSDKTSTAKRALKL